MKIKANHGQCVDCGRPCINCQEETITPKYKISDKVWCLLKFKNNPYWLTQEAREILAITIRITKKKTSIFYTFFTTNCEESRVFATKKEAEAAIPNE